jgi:hypothetical protein
MEYSFTQVNQTSVPTAPFHSMQLGHTFQRMLQNIADVNPTYGPPYLMKLDLSDGYYRVPLAPHAVLQLALTLLPACNGTLFFSTPLTPIWNRPHKLLTYPVSTVPLTSLRP